MTHKGIVKRGDATCAICSKGIALGSLVYFDSSKSQGKHLVHSNCWTELLKSRGGYRLNAKGKGKPGPRKSTEDLDPDF